MSTKDGAAPDSRVAQPVLEIIDTFMANAVKCCEGCAEHNGAIAHLRERIAAAVAAPSVGATPQAQPFIEGDCTGYGCQCGLTTPQAASTPPRFCKKPLPKEPGFCVRNEGHDGTCMPYCDFTPAAQAETPAPQLEKFMEASKDVFVEAPQPSSAPAAETLREAAQRVCDVEFEVMQKEGLLNETDVQPLIDAVMKLRAALTPESAPRDLREPDLLEKVLAEIEALKPTANAVTENSGHLSYLLQAIRAAKRNVLCQLEVNLNLIAGGK